MGWLFRFSNAGFHAGGFCALLGLCFKAWVVRLFPEFAGLGCYNTVLGLWLDWFGLFWCGFVDGGCDWGLGVWVSFWVVLVWVIGFGMLASKLFLVLPCVGWCDVVLGGLSLL